MRNKLIYRFFISLFALQFFSLSATAQSSAGITGGLQYFLYAVSGFVILVLTIAIYFIIQNNKFQKAYNIKMGKANEPTGLRRWWSDLDKRFFTRAAPLEKEADVLLDHDYDGIKELDNALPPWWKWGFYFTLVIGVLYMFRFHVWKTGPTPEEEYNKEMAVATAKLEIFRKNNKESIDEKTVTMADAAGIAAAKKIFTGTCFPCHGANGEGNVVGPNLTDKYWIHGGSLGEIFKTITIGVPDKGMQAWGKTFTPTDIKNLASFVLSLQGTNPPNAKAPQGTLYTPAAASDTMKVIKDTIQSKPAK
jgi:cytochrome c oxidase cbb3-type subunit III